MIVLVWSYERFIYILLLMIYEIIDSEVCGEALLFCFFLIVSRCSLKSNLEYKTIPSCLWNSVKNYDWKSNMGDWYCEVFG